MHKILLPLDTKSLYLNIFNDNIKGHTCTVATPIKQGKEPNKYLNEVYKIPKQIDFENYDKLLNDLTKNSKSIVKINNVFVFDKIKVNGKPVDVNKSFCFYVKEEIDPFRAQYGRTKLHYPLSIKNDDLNIDNRKIINKISEMLNDYAFIVEAFEYDFEDDSLNFKTLIVGYNNIPYSKVFANYKGVAKKHNSFVKNYYDIYDIEIFALKKSYPNEEITINNFEEYINLLNENSKKVVEKHLASVGAYDIRNISDDYPYSLFDFQYYLNGEIKYAIVSGTYTTKTYFNLSFYQNQFMNNFDNVEIFVVKFGGKSNILEQVRKDEINDFNVNFNSIRFIK